MTSRTLTAAVLASLSLVAGNAFAAVGDVAARFNFRSWQLIENSRSGEIYATVDSDKTLAVINPQTLAVDHRISLASDPRGLCLSADGSRLYVSEFTSHSIAVFNTSTWQLEKRLDSPTLPVNLVMGNDNRLFVVGRAQTTNTYSLRQIDSDSGAAAGADLPFPSYASNSLAISPDRRTLYAADDGTSPSTLKVYDVSQSSVTLTATRQTGSSAKRIALSHDGKTIVVPDGTPSNCAVFSTQDLTLQANLGASYHGSAAFSPDDRFLYVSEYAPNKTLIYDMATIGTSPQPSMSFSNFEEGSTMVTGADGKYLFMSFPYRGPGVVDSTFVYATGFTAVPEPSVAIAGLSAMLSCATRGRRAS